MMQDFSPRKYTTAKVNAGYLERYQTLFSSLPNRHINLLELGVFRGESLVLWADYFPKSTIVGIDINQPDLLPERDNIHFFQGSQGDREFLTKVAEATAPEGFDIIIDDASHIGKLTEISFWHLLNKHLKSGGFYVIEDWGTGYWSDWPDGRSIKRHPAESGSGLLPTKRLKSHDYGMVGFIKRLIDEQGYGDAARRKLTGKNSRRHSKFEFITIFHGIVFVKKS